MNDEKTNNILPLVSVIIVNWNGKKHLKECFKSLEKLNYPKEKYEVIMADNASSDDSIEYTKKKFPFVKILELDKNYGFAEGSNKAVKYTNPKSEYIAFLNNDTIVDKDWLNELIKCAIKNSKTICSSIMLDYNNKKKIAGNVIKRSVFGLDIFVDKNKTYQPKKLYSGYTFYAIGSGMLIKTDLFIYLEGFDSLYFMYGEDAAIGWKAWLFGYKVITVPSSIYWHKIRGSSDNSKRSPEYIYLFWRNTMLNILKYPELKEAIKVLSLFSIISFASFFLFLIKKQFSLIFAIIKAYFSVIKMFPNASKERKVIQSKRKISDKELYKIGIFLSVRNSIKEIIKFAKNFNL